jgi:hypothetical protein
VYDEQVPPPRGIISIQGHVLYARGEHAASEPELRRALALDPAHGQAHFSLGVVQLLHSGPALENGLPESANDLAAAEVK